MSYIGRGLQSGAFRQLDDISSGFDGSDTTHTMQVNSTNVTVGDVNQILLSLGGVIQKPGTDFTVSASVLTFTTAPAANTSFFAILLGSDNGGTTTPTDDSVTASKIASSLGGDIVFNEDSNDHDFRIEGNGDANAFFLDAEVDRVYLGNNTNTSIHNLDARLQIVGTDFDKAAISMTRYSGDANGATLQFAKSRNATLGSHTIVSDNDELGKIKFGGSDGSDFDQTAAEISGFVNGTPSSGTDMPGGLAFKTTADGASTTTERMRIHSGGVVSIPGGIELGSALDATAANVLDDYEEGTWTAAFTDGSTNYTMNNSAKVGRYVKIGDNVWIWGYFAVSDVDGGGANENTSTKISGLPFTMENNAENYAPVHIGYVNSFALPNALSVVMGYVEISNTYIYLVRNGSTDGTEAITGVHVSDGGTVMLAGMYRTT